MMMLEQLAMLELSRGRSKAKLYAVEELANSLLKSYGFTVGVDLPRETPNRGELFLIACKAYADGEYLWGDSVAITWEDGCATVLALDLVMRVLHWGSSDLQEKNERTVTMEKAE